ncbi:hypothetical protein [Okeania sp. KiyG1]|uniref:hypothetical protein n=1 Tax=Okeania sp. KiyG1 TaxID=2720165 RepID=UPI0019218E8C|nr:hypothetical protein [Okeania sp. KiyG1]GGA30024.1 hypothetical protein CYANOKiyG1_46520 [Okeania sp. KiyG1]
MTNIPEWVKTEWVERRQKQITDFKRNESPFESILKIRGEIAAYSRALLLKHQIFEKKFVIFGQPRTGSTLLVQLLNNQPKIYCEKEILSAKDYRKMLFPNLYIQGRRVKFSGKVYGFKLMISQLPEEQYVDPEKFMFNLYYQGWAIIHLIRNNYLRSIISSMLASSRNQWEAKSKSSLNYQTIKIDCNKLIELLKRREIYRVKEKEILEKLDHIKVIYEEDLLLEENHQNTCDRIFNYLGLESIPIKTKLVKTTSNQLSDVIENYEEFVEKISQTKYAKFLSN